VVIATKEKMKAIRFVSTTSRTSSSIRGGRRFTSSTVLLVVQLLLVLIVVVLTSSLSGVSARLLSSTTDTQEEENVQQQADEQQQQQQQQYQATTKKRHYHRYLSTELIPNQFIVQIASTANRRNIIQELNTYTNNESEIMYKYRHALKGFAVTGITETILQAFTESLLNPGDIVLIEPDYTIELYYIEQEYNVDDDDLYFEYPAEHSQSKDPPQQQQQQQEPQQGQQAQQQQQQQRTGATWGIDRVDQKNLPLDETFTSTFDGTGVDVYIIDTGVMTSHQEFKSNSNGNSRVTLLKDFTNDNDGIDYNGHGTHVAGK
jgi:subtilisin family serine protease